MLQTENGNSNPLTRGNAAESEGEARAGGGRQAGAARGGGRGGTKGGAT